MNSQTLIIMLNPVSKEIGSDSGVVETFTFGFQGFALLTKVRGGHFNLPLIAIKLAGWPF